MLIGKATLFRPFNTEVKNVMCHKIMYSSVDPMQILLFIKFSSPKTVYVSHAIKYKCHKENKTVFMRHYFRKKKELDYTIVWLTPSEMLNELIPYEDKNAGVKLDTPKAIKQHLSKLVTQSTHLTNS